MEMESIKARLMHEEEDVRMLWKVNYKGIVGV